MNKSIKNILLFLIGIIIFLIFIFETSSPGRLLVIFNFGWLNTASATILTFFIILIAAWRWHILINLQSNNAVSFMVILKTSIWARLSSQTTSQIVGDFGLKMLMLNNLKIPFQKILFSVIWDKSFELLMLIAAFIGYISITHFITSAILLWLFIPLCFILLLPFSMLSIQLTRFFLKKRKGIVKDLQHDLTIKNASSISILSLGKYILVAFRYFIIINYFKFDIKFFDVFLGTALTQLGNIIAITPGGLGFIETGWIGFFKYFNIKSDYTGAFLLTQRMIILLSIFIVYVLFLGYDFFKIKHRQVKFLEAKGSE